MSELKVSRRAVAHLQSQIAEREIVRPLVHICWMAGPADVTRGPQGEVFWQREPARWCISVSDDAAFYELAIEKMPEHQYWLERKVEVISGLHFMPVGKADNPSMSGCTLDFLDEALFIREEN